MFCPPMFSVLSGPNSGSVTPAFTRPCGLSAVQVDARHHNIAHSTACTIPHRDDMHRLLERVKPAARQYPSTILTDSTAAPG